MGGRKPLLNKLAREIWLWCEGKNLWLSVYHIPGKLNKTADGLSRMTGKLSDDMEWPLNSGVFKIIERKMGKCYIDLFASSNNFKLPKYVSFLPDPKAIAVNAFSLTWTNELNYIFSPFSMIGPVLKKIWEDKAEVILVAPLFSTQLRFPQLLRLISGPSYILPKVKDLLSLPHKKKHPLTTMKMGVFRLSGNTCRIREFQDGLPKSSMLPGEVAHSNSTGHISRDGCVFVVKGKHLQLTHL